MGDYMMGYFWKFWILENYRIFEFFNFGKLRYYYNSKRGV